MDDRENTKTQYLASELENICQQLSYLGKSIIQGDSLEKVRISTICNDFAAIFVVEGGVIKSVSNKIRGITGYSEQDLIGTSPLSFVLPEDRDLIKKYIVNTFSQVPPSVHEFRILTKRADTKWVLASISPINNNGSPAIITNLIDITDYKKAQESYEQIQELYHDLCENANDMIQCIDPAGLIIYANSTWCKLTGYLQEEISNLSIFEIIPKDYREYWHEFTQRAISGEIINGIEVVFIGKYGKRIPVEGNINCRFADGQPVYIRAIYSDVTKRKNEQAKAEALFAEAQEINKRLQQSSRELEEFAHIASHDLQEPIRKISSFGGLLKESLKDKLDNDESENLDFMIDGAKRMQLIIEDLLTYSRITTKAKPFQSVDPNKVIDDLKKLELSSIMDEKKGIIVVPKPLLTIYGDQSQIYQLFQNLILNGFKFHLHGVSPTVTVESVPVQNNKVKFYIKDNGIGIDPKYHEQIFTMFKRLHSKEKYNGTGIGLAICKKIVERHGGEIGVESKSGKGSTFWFTVPRFGDSGKINIGDNGVDK